MDMVRASVVVSGTVTSHKGDENPLMIVDTSEKAAASRQITIGIDLQNKIKMKNC